jgi:hypothetical protein
MITEPVGLNTLRKCLVYKIVLTARAIKDLEQINVQDNQRIASTKIHRPASGPQHGYDWPNENQTLEVG